MTAAAFDYSRLQATATRLIERFGRPLQLVRAARPTTTDPVAGKPWLSTSKGDADPDAAGAQSIVVTGVTPETIRQDREGQTVEAKNQVAFFTAEEEIPEEVGPDWKLVDPSDGRTWEIVQVRPVKPGPLLLLYKATLGL